MLLSTFKYLTGGNMGLFGQGGDGCEVALICALVWLCIAIILVLLFWGDNDSRRKGR
jgi:hypothetical protein